MPEIPSPYKEDKEFRFGAGDLTPEEFLKMNPAVAKPIVDAHKDIFPNTDIPSFTEDDWQRVAGLFEEQENKRNQGIVSQIKLKSPEDQL